MSVADVKIRERPLVIAGMMGLAGLATALIYAFHSTPYTMVLFMGVGLTLLGGAALIFAIAIFRDYRGRLRNLESRDYEDGEVICSQGEPAEHLYVVSAGEVEFFVEEVGRGEIPIGKLGPGDHFGDMAILGDTPTQASARAVGKVQVITIHRDDFRTLYAQLPNLRQKIIQEREKRLESVERKLGTKLS